MNRRNFAVDDAALLTAFGRQQAQKSRRVGWSAG